MVFSVKDGFSKRPGSQFVAKLAGINSTDDIRMHVIERDEAEQYLVLYGATTGGDNILRIFGVDGDECLVRISSAAEAYLELNSPSASQLRPVTVADYTFLLNSTVTVLSKTSDEYATEADHRDFDVMVSHSPADETHHRTEQDTNRTAGYWKYDHGDGTFAIWKTGDVPDTFDEPAEYLEQGKGGFRIGFEKKSLSLANAGFNHTTKVLTLNNGFDDYEWESGDEINITVGTAVNVGWYEITTRTDGDSIILAEDITNNGSDPADVDADGVGKQYEVLVDLQNDTLADMHDVALGFQRGLRAAGCADGLISFTYTSKKNGYFTITSPYRGEYSHIHDPTSPSSADHYDYAQDTTQTFWATAGEKADEDDPRGPTDGTGDEPLSQVPILDRWERVAAPNQETAELDAVTMPVQVVRTGSTMTAYDDYGTLVLAGSPFAYWRLGESAGAADNAEGTAAYDGTYTGGFTLEASSLLIGDADTAVTLNGTTGYVDCGTMGTLGANIGSTGLTLEAWVKMSAAGNYTIIGTDETYPSFQDIRLATNSQGGLWFRIRDSVNYNKMQLSTVEDLDICDDVAHHIVATWNASTNEAAVYVDGQVLRGMRQVSSDTAPNDFDNFTNHLLIGAVGGGPSSFLNGTIDEVAVYDSVLSESDVLEHYLTGMNRAVAVFDVDPVDWKPRHTGDRDTNPVPSLWNDNAKIADIAFHRNRLVLAGDENLVFSQAGDFFNFYLEDADNIADADPIDVALSASQVTLIDRIVPFRKALVIFTKAGQQFELNAPETLTPDTATITPSTAYRSVEGVQPEVTGSRIFFPAVRTDVNQLYEYFYSDSEAANVAADVSAHVEGYLPSTIQKIEAAMNADTVLVLPSGGYEIWVYRWYWRGVDKVQSAWGKWVFDSHETIWDIGLIGNYCYMLVSTISGEEIIVKIPLLSEPAPTGMSYDPKIDNRIPVAGSYSEVNEETTWNFGFDDTTMDCVVKGGDWSGEAGAIVEVTEVDAESVKVAGDLSAHDCYVGRKFDMNVELSRPFVRGRDGQSIIDHEIQIHKLAATHLDTGSYTVKVVQYDRVDREYTYTIPTSASGLIDSGDFAAFILGNTRNTTLYIQDDTPYPVRITGMELICTGTARTQ